MIGVIEGEQHLVAGAKITYSVVFLGGTYITGTPTATAVVKSDPGTAVTDTIFPSGTITTNRNTVMLKEFVAPADFGGETVVVLLTAVVDGNTETRKLYFKIHKTTDVS